MRKSLFSGLILTALFSTSAFAANGKDTIFSCTATDGKPITVKKVGNDYEYTHGQLTFKNPINQVLANDHTEIAVGSGFITYVIELKNQGRTYSVGLIQARGSKTIEEPGVDIYTKNGPESTIQCSLTKPIKHNFESTQIRRTGL